MRWFFAALLLVALPVSAGQNPVVPVDAPDPGVLRTGSTYTMVTTSGDAPDAFPIRTSADLASWTPKGAVFPAGHWPSWASGNFWAPEIHQVGTKFVCYYVATNRADGHLCVGAASADSPLGPYTDLGHPLVDDPRGGSIDPTEFADTDGIHYLYWKFDGNAQGKPCQIYVLKLAPDGLSLEGDPVSAPSVLTNDRPWEGTVVEAPEVVKKDGYYYLYYSGNYYGDGSYALGVARSSSPTGPFTMAPSPVLVSKGGAWGPGHNSLVTDSAGNDYTVFAAHTGTPTGPREVFAAPIHYLNGWPVVGDGTAPESFPPPDPGIAPPPRPRPPAPPVPEPAPAPAVHHRHFWDMIRDVFADLVKDLEDAIGIETHGFLGALGGFF
jgi:beta-xylosidase